MVDDYRIHLINSSEKSFKDFIELESWLSSFYNNRKIENELDKISLSFPIIKDNVIKLLKDEEKTVYSVIEDRLSNRSLIFLLITNIIQNILPTSRYHIYRGVLSSQGEGLLQIWDYSVVQLFNLNYYGKEDAVNDKNWIREQIKEVG